MVALFLSGCSISDLISAPEPSAPVPMVEPLAAPEVEIKDDLTPLSINDQTFYIELATTPAMRERGLMHRESMPANQGMLFEFEGESLRSFWMKNTLIPLEMIWIDAKKTIVDMQLAEPCVTENCTIYQGKAPAKYVLELNQNVLRAQIGDRVEF